jgi:hypothetical protein
MSMADGWPPDAAHRDYLKKIVGAQGSGRPWHLCYPPFRKVKKRDGPTLEALRRCSGSPLVVGTQRLDALAAERLDAHPDHREIVGSASLPHVSSSGGSAQTENSRGRAAAKG